MAPSATATFTEPCPATTPAAAVGGGGKGGGKGDMVISATGSGSKPLPQNADGQQPTALEAISQGDVLPGIPQFSSFAAERAHILTHMAATFRLWARSGFNEGQSGHISVRDPEFEDVMWMNPLGVHFGLLTAGDMLALRISDGKVVGGKGNPKIGGGRTANRAGWFIHSAIHRRRPHDVHAICHAHTHNGRAWAAFGRPIEMLTQDACNFHNHLAVYTNYGGIVFEGDEGERIADALGAHNRAAILQNHGLLTVGTTVDEAGYMFGLLDRSCGVQLAVEAARGSGKSEKTVQVIDDEEAAYNYEMASEANALYRDAQPDLEYEMARAGGEEVLAKGVEELTIQQ